VAADPAASKTNAPASATVLAESLARWIHGRVRFWRAPAPEVTALTEHVEAWMQELSWLPVREFLVTMSGPGGDHGFIDVVGQRQDHPSIAVEIDSNMQQSVE
jgi:hypothetical protein